MQVRATLALMALLMVPLRAVAATPADTTVAGYHGDAARSGNLIAPGLAWHAATGLRRDSGFDGAVTGHVYAQPLYWRRPGEPHGRIVVATESDEVDALDAVTGRTLWHTTLGAPVRRAALPCGNIDPLGVTGTPVIDPDRGSLYLDAMVDQGGTPQHLVFGLRLADGAVLPGWPVNVQQALRQQGIPFTPREQNQRAALAILAGRVFVAFGGHYRDCGGYHGTLLGIATDSPRAAAAWTTRGLKGGIWAPGGITVADGALFFTTGNTENAEQWADGEGVFRLGPDLKYSGDPRDFFAPADWKALDDADLDISGVAPLPINLPDGARRLLALGKNGRAYLLNRDNLGGIGGQLAVLRAAEAAIITAPAFYPVGPRVFVAYPSSRPICSDGRTGAGLAAIAVTATGLAPAWCAPLDGHGAAIVTTTDGQADPIVWIAGAEGDDRLHGFRGDTGQPLYTSPEPLAGLRHFVTILAAEGRLYIATDGRIAAFTWNTP